MAEQDKQSNSIFSESRMPHQGASTFSMRRKEWWLNVNYAETIEIKDAVGVQSLRARLAS